MSVLLTLMRKNPVLTEIYKGEIPVLNVVWLKVIIKNTYKNLCIPLKVYYSCPTLIHKWTSDINNDFLGWKEWAYPQFTIHTIKVRFYTQYRTSCCNNSSTVLYDEYYEALRTRHIAQFEPAFTRTTPVSGAHTQSQLVCVNACALRTDGSGTTCDFFTRPVTVWMVFWVPPGPGTASDGTSIFRSTAWNLKKGNMCLQRRSRIIQTLRSVI